MPALSRKSIPMTHTDSSELLRRARSQTIGRFGAGTAIIAALVFGLILRSL